MKYLQGLGIKFIFTAVVVYSLFGIFYNTSLWNLFLISLTVTGVTYLGDLFLLPRLGNLVSPVLDFGAVFLLLWFLGSSLIQVSLPIILTSLAGAYLIAICEAIFHIYMKEEVFEAGQEMPSFNQLQTEFAEELDPDRVTKNISDNKQTDVDR